jgi:hypothetical protein
MIRMLVLFLLQEINYGSYYTDVDIFATSSFKKQSIYSITTIKEIIQAGLFMA